MSTVGLDEDVIRKYIGNRKRPISSASIVRMWPLLVADAGDRYIDSVAFSCCR